MLSPKPDIKPAASGDFIWTNAESLEGFRKYVEAEAQKAIDWYWAAKKLKKRPSQGIQFLSLALTAAAGLVPIVIQILKPQYPAQLQNFDSGPIASLLVGMAAALIGLDKAFGYSTGWIRYTLTASSMTALLQEFRADWVALVAGSASPPTTEQQVALINRGKDFISGVQNLLLQETKEWANEFQTNSTQMEKDVKSQLDALKAQMDRVAKEKEAAGILGAISLSVTSASQPNGFDFDISLETPKGTSTSSVSNSNTWTRLGVPPGKCKITVDTKTLQGQPISRSVIVDVPPGETAVASITVP